MNTSFALRQQTLKDQIAEASVSRDDLEKKLAVVSGELAVLTSEQGKFLLLESVCESLDKLRTIGAAPLFWGDTVSPDMQEQLVGNGKAAYESFSRKLQEVEGSRSALATSLQEVRDHIDMLQDDLAEVIAAEEDSRYDFIIQREPARLAFHPAVMPWSSNEEDRKRMRKILLASFLFMFASGTVPLLWKFPPVDRNKAVKVPERIVQMVKKKEPPKPVEKPKTPLKETPEEIAKPKDVKQPTPTEKPTQTAVKDARARAETKGVLAFKDSFSDLVDDDITSRLGADARISNASRQVGGAPGHGAEGSRSLIMSQAGSGSGGIANAGISRGGVGGASGGAISGGGHSVSRASSAVASSAKETGRPLSGSGIGPARTDEEIQIVFDKYKSALYRIYNRELRNDPTLRGKMVLALTIEPDGRVSACRVQSTDMNSPALSSDIVERVLKFNFGAKEGVPTTKILYPIDFLPAG